MRIYPSIEVGLWVGATVVAVLAGACDTRGTDVQGAQGADIGSSVMPDAGVGDSGSENPTTDSGTTDGPAMDSSVGDAGVDPRSLPPGGFIDTIFQSTGRYGFAEFWSDVTIQGTPPGDEDGVHLFPVGPPVRADHCTLGPKTSSATITYAYVDVGSQLSVSGAGEMHIYERDPSSTTPSYNFFNFNDLPDEWGGGMVSFDIPGTATVAGAHFSDFFEVPASDITVTSTVFTSTATADVTFAWTPHSAHRTLVNVAYFTPTFELRRMCDCVAEDDGEFQIPRACLALFESFGPSLDGGIITLAFQVYGRDVEYRGRRVTLEVSAGRQIDLVIRR